MYAVLAILSGGAIAGMLDIAFACTFWSIKAGVAPTRILQSVAAGLLGAASFQGGAATAALGMVLQLVIATGMAAVYYAVARRWPLLVRRPVAGGAGFGLAAYAVMNYVVVPLSAARPGSHDPLWVGLSIVVHVALIGVPIALACARALTRR
ncbi:MAG TPA: hypothetical protein VHW23_47070 [Kofleriaceae bacterium]|jgi:hypothetical protein|nr:hypothetical protein [Kofleriaceae bacterium]